MPPRPRFFAATCLTLSALTSVVGACAPDTDEPSLSDSSVQIWGGSRVAEADPLAGTTVALTRSNGFPFCTGTYLGRGAVLTAAHCVTGLDTPLLYVSFDLEVPTAFDPIYGDRGAASARSRRISRTVAHSAFDARRFSATNISHEPSRPLYDVGLVFFEGAAPSIARPVRLVDPNADVSPNSDITLAGYGRSDADGGDYGRLYKVSTRVGDIRSRSREIVDGPNTEKGSCIGDSGGPVLVGAHAGGIPTVTGIVSYGPSDCETGTGFNTDLRFFGDWVNSNARAVEIQGRPVSAVVNDLDTFVPTAKGSFFQLCRDRAGGAPDDRKTVEAILTKLGTFDCGEAARLALSRTELDLSHLSLTSIRPLSHFVSLKALNLSHNAITELSPISYLAKLERLNLVEAGIQWNAYHHPHVLSPWTTGSVGQFLHRSIAQGLSPQTLREAPYTQGIWLTALRNLVSLSVEAGVSPNTVARFAQPTSQK